MTTSKSPVIRVIINADDLGISDAVNDRVFALMARGIITSATLMVNGPAFGAALRRLHEFPHCSFGVHLNITEFRPLSSAPGLRPILNPDGSFNSRIRQVGPKYSLARAVQDEWRMQIAQALRLGVPVSHVDSHHHVHTIPFLLPAVRAAVREFHIGRMRGTMTLYPDGRRRRVLLAGKWVWAAAASRLCGVTMPDEFTGLQVFHGLTEERRPRTGTIELMTHPGAADNQREETLLEFDWLGNAYPQARRISYNAL
jgi:predicted glycoside hydrolase/deacetylase ChbG (UPF0249 family)